MNINLIGHFGNYVGSMNQGSYRIWINDLQYYFKEVGINSEINSKNPDKCSVHIYSKNLFWEGPIDSSKINGCINPNADQGEKIKEYDFAIVGSIEERESIIKYIKHVFIFPLIEKMYLHVEPKNHVKKDQIIIGYHGNPHHLNHFHLGLKGALEKLSKEFNILLKFTTGTDSEWTIGKPNIPCEFKKWELDTILSTIQTFDIGIVPNISQAIQNNKMDTNMAMGLHNTDYQVRFKNKSNNGRILVLAQCGIPIVADITPSNLHLLGNPDNGFACSSEEGWFDSLYKLCKDHELRNFVSKNAYDEVKRLYDPLKWAEKLYENILKIKK